MKGIPCMNACRPLATSLLVLLSGAATAGGFALNEQNIKSMGAALAGRASNPADATTIYTNPAGLAQLEGTQLSGNVTLIKASADISESAVFPGGGTAKGDMVPTQPVGAGFASHALNDRLAIGIGMYAPFGLATNYEDTFDGRYFGDKSKVTVKAVQPTVGYRLSPEFSVGAGIAMNRLDGVLTAAASPSLPGSSVDVEGDDTALGYHLGLLWAVQPETRLGLTYHSKVKYGLTGTTEVRNILSNGVNTFNAHLDIATPETTDLSLSHRLNNDVTAHALATFTRWSRIQDLVIVNQGAPGSLATLSEHLGWHDTWLYSVGADWQYLPSVQLRAGIGHDETPTGGYRSVRVPSGDRDYLTLGASYVFSPTWSLDWAYMYIREDSAHVAQDKFPSDSPKFVADYRNRAHLFGIQLNARL